MFGAMVRGCGLLRGVSWAPCSLWLFTVALAGLSDCNEPYSSHPTLESLPPASSSRAIEALFAPSVTADAAPPTPNAYHALTVTQCLSSATPCLPSQGEAALSTSYLVVLGSGRGAVRSRGQATADVYNELRYRTTSGVRLDAEIHTRSDGGIAGPGASGGQSRKSASDADPLAQCAQDLLDFVDGAGEVTLDVLHESGSSGCMVSMGRFSGDGGTSQCLVQDPEHPHGPPRGRKGIPF
jgi:hypothetical protein